MTINELLAVLRTATDQNVRAYMYPLGCVPTTIDSWRGNYAEPALGWSPAGYTKDVVEYPTVKSLISELEKAIGGRVYEGWKGGEYQYNGDEPLHIDNPGDCTNTAISHVEVRDWKVVIQLGALT